MAPTIKITFREKGFNCPHSFGYRIGIQDLMIHLSLKTTQKITIYIETKVPYKPNSCKAFLCHCSEKYYPGIARESGCID